MRELDLPTVAGNHDLLVAGALVDFPDQVDRMQASAYNAGLLSTVPGAVEYLLSLPLFLEEEDHVAVHHSPFHLPPRGETLTIHGFRYLDSKALGQCLDQWRGYSKRSSSAVTTMFPPSSNCRKRRIRHWKTWSCIPRPLRGISPSPWGTTPGTG